MLFFAGSRQIKEAFGLDRLEYGLSGPLGHQLKLNDTETCWIVWCHSNMCDLVRSLSLHFSNGEPTEFLKHRIDFGRPWDDLFSSDWLVVKTCHTCQSLTEVSGLRPDKRLNSLTFSLLHPRCYQSVRDNQQLTHRLTRLLLPKQWVWLLTGGMLHPSFLCVSPCNVYICWLYCTSQWHPEKPAWPEKQTCLRFDDCSF